MLTDPRRKLYAVLFRDQNRLKTVLPRAVSDRYDRVSLSILPYAFARFEFDSYGFYFRDERPRRTSSRRGLDAVWSLAVGGGEPNPNFRNINYVRPVAAVSVRSCRTLARFSDVSTNSTHTHTHIITLMGTCVCVYLFTLSGKDGARGERKEIGDFLWQRCARLTSSRGFDTRDSALGACIYIYFSFSLSLPKQRRFSEVALFAAPRSATYYVIFVYIIQL